MHDLGAIGREDGVLGRRRLNANLQALDVLDFVNFLLAVHRAQAERGEPDHVRALHRLLDHRLDGFGNPRIGERLRQMVFGAKQKVQRHHAGLRRYRRGIGGRRDGEIDIAGFQQLQHLRLLAKLRAGILIDQELTLAQLLHLVGEDVIGNAVTGRVRLVIGEAVVLFLRIGAERNGCDGGTEQDVAHRQCGPHLLFAAGVRGYFHLPVDANRAAGHTPRVPVSGRTSPPDRNSRCRIAKEHQI